MACINGHENVVISLLNFYADVNIKSNVSYYINYCTCNNVSLHTIQLINYYVMCNLLLPAV